MSKKNKLRLAESVWILGDGSDETTGWVRKQIEQLVPTLCGSAPQFSAQLEDKLCMVVGSPESNLFVKEAVEQKLIDLDALGRDDFLLKQTVLNGTDVMLIVGRNPRAAMYGVFDFFEQLGCTFLISRDAVPEANPDLLVPPMDKVGQTDCSWRGVFIGTDWPTNFMMSLPDHKAMLDQMAKMKMNRIIHYHFEQEPFIDYTYKGERKLVGDISHPDSGYISYGRHFTGSLLVKDIPVGKEKFDRKKITSMEFQDIASSDEALDKGCEVIQSLIEMGKERGIGTWVSTIPTFISPNLSKYTRRMPRTHRHWSAHVSCTDPVLTEINRARIEGILKAYPNAEGIFLAIPEGFYDDPYPETEALIEREWDNYAEALEWQKEYWNIWPDEEQQKAHIRADIGFVEIVKNTIAVAKEIKPDIKLGLLTICKAYLLPYLDTIFPKDMPFVDFESRSLWTQGGAPLHLFKKIEGRECAIIPRAVDDGSMAGLQFPMWQYDADGFLTSPEENGTRGLMIQTSHIRGNEHNMRFLAEGMWNPSLTPESFYSDYAKKIFGKEAMPLLMEAFKVLEGNDEYLGGRGQGNMPWNMIPYQILILQTFKDFNQPFYKAPFNEEFLQECQRRADKFKQALVDLDRGIELFEQASSLATDAGRKELHYLITRTKGYRTHLLSLIELSDLYARYFDVFKLLGNLEAFKQAFSELVEEAKCIEQRTLEAAGHFADCVEHVSDLGVLWMISHKMGVGSRCLRQYLENILAFYEGREYWNKVDWDIMFGHCPFPVYAMNETTAKEQAEEYEPG